ncbi:hypothetical protein LSAT2_026011 [Lamellibrachia satsuma]|nr:hypothetical protein LSAT2_026011 [Lamellibrachia satsuma]
MKASMLYMGIEEMFSRHHLAGDKYGLKHLAGDKYGLKLIINAIILRIIKALKGMHAKRMDDAKCHELDLFTDAYKFWSHELFAPTRYQAIAQSVDKARRPVFRPEKDDMLKLKVYVTREIERLSSSLIIQIEDFPAVVTDRMPPHAIQRQKQ